MKWKLAAASLILAVLMAVGQSEAAEKWDMPPVGRMVLPAHVTMEKGEQQALPFVSSGGPRWAFTKDAMLGGTFYTLTYADGPEFSYGWAASAVMGSQYLQQAGIDYRNKTPSEQMDLIAERINADLVKQGASFSGSTPLVRVDDKKNPRWEGSFVMTGRENNITYREAYTMVLQVSGFQVNIGIICSDADRKDLVAALSNMMKKRTFYSDKELLRMYLSQGNS